MLGFALHVPVTLTVTVNVPGIISSSLSKAYICRNVCVVSTSTKYCLFFSNGIPFGCHQCIDLSETSIISLVYVITT